MSYDNVYNSPEKHGLKIIFSNDIADSYKFNILVVFKSLYGGAYYFAQDSGCSCPVPFENFEKIDDLTPIERSNFEYFEQQAKRYLEPAQIQDIRRAIFGRARGVTKKVELQDNVKKLEAKVMELTNDVNYLRTKLEQANKKLLLIKGVAGN